MAIKTARELVLLPYTQRTVTERPGGRRGDRGRDAERLGAVATGLRPPSVVRRGRSTRPRPGDAETEAAVTAEVAELVEEMVEDAAAAPAAARGAARHEGPPA